MRIAVAGGTGVVGVYAVKAAEEAGHQVVVMSRKVGVDVRTGDGLAAALQGVDVIIDTTNPTTLSRAKATAFFTEITANLQSVGAAQGAAHLITLSIVGLERVPGFGYYEAKLAQEAAASKGPVPVTIVRATQFHEFPAQILSRVHLGPVAAVPIMRVQPVAARSVGQVLAEVAASPALGTTIEVGGPEPQDLVDLARRIVSRRGTHTKVVPLRVPGRGGQAMRSGAVVPRDGARLVGPTFSEWLEGSDLAAVTG
jgi:uncharacterized protein YbjT (DUF2867 family)